MINKKIPFFDLSRQYKKYKNILNKKIQNVLSTQAFIGGHYVSEFEKNISKFLNVSNTISCNSGTDALWMALKALNIKKNDIVLTTPFSFIASSSEISAHEAHPVFIDIDKNTYNIDTQKLEKWIIEECEFSERLIHKKTGYNVIGILPVDIFGQCADYKTIRQIANKYNLWIIQDACQAIGSKDNDGILAGNHGDISCFSFYPTKNLGAYGDGGCCTTNNSELAKKLLRIRNHGRESHYNYIEQGINSRLDGIQAAILDEKLKFLNNFNEKRSYYATIYNKKLSKIKEIKLSKEITGTHVYHQYCIELIGIDREKLMQKLSEKGIGTNIYYPKSLNEIEFLNTDERLKTDCTISENLTKNILALPIWPELKKSEILYICKQLKEIIKNNQKDLISNSVKLNKELTMQI